MKRPLPLLRFLPPLLPAAFSLSAIGLSAQPAPGPAFDWELVYAHQTSADLDSGGDLSLSRVQGSVGAAWFLDRRSRLKISFDYGVDSYDFGIPSDGSGGMAPWGDITNVEVNAFWSRALENGWQVFAAPGVGASSESGFDGDAIRFSLLAGARTQASETLSYGLGIVAYTGMEETRAFPFLSIEWEFAPSWKLQNALRPGPVGPAGLEVAYSGDQWSLAAGATYRSWRFQIDGAGPTADGFAEHSGVPLYARYSTTLSESLAIDLYGGFLLGGELEIEDSEGRDLDLREDVEAAPFLAIAISGSF